MAMVIRMATTSPRNRMTAYPTSKPALLAMVALPLAILTNNLDTKIGATVVVKIAKTICVAIIDQLKTGEILQSPKRKPMMCFGDCFFSMSFL